MIKRLADRLFRWFCHPDYYDEIVGDLEEMYHRSIHTNARFVQWRYLFQVLSLFRPGLIRSFLQISLTNPAIFLHYIHISTRILLRQKFYSLINILGLAVGLGVCLLIYQYIHFELSYDQFHKKAENIYRLTQTTIRNGEQLGTGVYTTYALGPRSKETIPEIKEFVRVHPQEEGLILINSEKNVRHQEDKLWYVDSNFLLMFDFPLKYGDQKTILDDKHSIVITEPMAIKYFGYINPVGKLLRISGGTLSGDFIVTGVLNSLPVNSHLQFDFLLPMTFLLEHWRMYSEGDGWGWDNFVTYVTVNEDVNLDEVRKKFDQLIKTYKGEELNQTNFAWKIDFQPLADIHLKSDYSRDLAINHGDIQIIHSFSIIALLILLMAWGNFINLSTAQAIHRAKEVGVRKSIGALRSQLISQFILESALINLVAALLSIGIAYLTLPILNSIIGIELTFSVLQSFEFWFGFAATLVVGSILSGLYPAFILSSFKPVSILKSSNITLTRGPNLRKGLIVFQFTVSLLLISGTYLIYQQLTYMKNQELGFDIEKILVVNGPRVILETSNLKGAALASKYQTFKTQIVKQNSINSVSGTSSVPGKGYTYRFGIRKLDEPASIEKEGNIVLADDSFIDTYDLEFLAERSFSDEMKRRDGVVINEEAVKVLGLGSPQDAMGKALIFLDDTLIVQGVIKNIHWSSLKNAQEPTFFVIDNLYNVYFSFKINTSNIPQTIDQIKATYHSVFPDDPFYYFFLDDDFNRQYQADLQFGNLFSAFSILAIIIACLGLFALVSYSATLRIKEIGIRKVLGAGIGHLMMLLSREYLWLLLVALLLAVPAIIIGGRTWLNNYAYRTNLGIDLFLIPGLVLLIISLLTVSYRTYTSAKANPVESLKTE